MHNIGNLRRCQSHSLQLLIMAEHLSWSIVKGNLSTVYHDQTLYIFCHVFHAVGYKNDGDSTSLMKL